MNLKKQLNQNTGFRNLDLLARQIVEGFISGIHKSPFHGFSAEFAEHKSYNYGEGTKHIDWKLFAKTEKLYTKKYEEETNLRCHLIIDNSSSMHFPALKAQSIGHLNKIGYSILASAVLMELLRKQRDAVGLSLYSNQYERYIPEKSSTMHHHLLLKTLEDTLNDKPVKKETKTYTYLHQIAEKLKRRSLLFLFTDMFQNETSQEQLFEALRHLRYNKHEVVLFHIYDGEKELKFNFSNTPKRFTDVETGEKIDLYADHIKDAYTKAVTEYFSILKLKCLQYNIKYFPIDIHENFNTVITTFLIERKKF